MHNSEVIQSFLARQLKNGSPLAFQLPVQIAPIHSTRKKNTPLRAVQQIRNQNENSVLPSPRLLLTKTRSTPTRSSPVNCSKNNPYPFIEQENKKGTPKNSEKRDSKAFIKRIEISQEYIAPSFRCTPTGLTTVKSVENLRAIKKVGAGSGAGTPSLNLSRVQSPKRNFIKSPDFPSTSLNKYASSDVQKVTTTRFLKEDLESCLRDLQKHDDYQILPSDPRYKIIESIIRENLVKLNAQFFPFTIFQDVQNHKYTVLFKETFSIICPECLKIMCFQLSFQCGIILICRKKTCSGKILYSNDITRKARSGLWAFTSNGTPRLPFESEVLKTARDQQETLVDTTSSYQSKLVKRPNLIRGRNLKQNKETIFTEEKDRMKIFMQNKRPIENIDLELNSKKYQTTHRFFTKSPREGIPLANNRTPTLSSIQRVTTNLPTTRDDIADKIETYLKMEMSRNTSNLHEEKSEASLEKKGKIREAIYSKLSKPTKPVAVEVPFKAKFSKKVSTLESSSENSVDEEEEEHQNMKSIFNFYR